MGLLDFLTRKRTKQKVGTAIPSVPTVTPAPDRPGLTLPAKPKKRGKTPEEWEVSLSAYRQAMRLHFAEIAAYNREKWVALGITRYRWIAVDVHGTCDVAKRNNGKIFSLNSPPPDGHPCEGLCNSIDWCRCQAKPVIDDFD